MTVRKKPPRKRTAATEAPKPVGRGRQASVTAVMKPDLLTLTLDTGCMSALRLAVTNKKRHLLVIENGTLYGVVTTGDLSRATPRDLVLEHMCSPVLCAAPDTTLEDAVEIMVEHDVSFLPIIADHVLLGVVDRSALSSLDSRLARPLPKPEVTVPPPN